ncbi:UgpQ Glycerophosphoryl diester phosphodiesterase [Candidatus Nanopelagicaceae bacterium]
MLIYAHRGASADYPEMTETAYMAAIDQGADGFECDLRLTRDEIPVLWHNASMLERAGNHGLIAEMNFADVQRAYPQILTLDNFLDIAITAHQGVLIETKHPVISGNRVEEILVKKIQERKVLSKINVSVMSFSWSAIEKVKRIDSTIPTTFLMTSRTLWPQVRFSSAQAIGPGINEVRANPELVARLMKLGKSVSVWTVDNAADIELCKELGVDILITNTPAHARTFL